MVVERPIMLPASREGGFCTSALGEVKISDPPFLAVTC